MLNLYNSGFPFDNDNNYIMLNCFKHQPNIDIISASENKPGLYISAHDIPEIPSTIKYCQIYCKAIHYKNLILPNTLEYLQLQLLFSDIFNNDILDCITIPTSIKSLSIMLDNDTNTIVDYNSANNVNNAVKRLLNNTNFKIPKNIEYLKINFQLPNIEEYTNLKVLVLDASQNTQFNEPLDNLPASLEWLEIGSLQFNHPLTNLPPGLKVLIFAQNRIWNYYDGYRHSLDRLPSGLEVLHFPDFCSQQNEIYLANFENLPPFLKILAIPQVMPDDINYDCLPDSIEILEWPAFRKCYQKISRFPANLKKIKCQKFKCDHCYVHGINNQDHDNDEKNKIIKYFENMHFIIEDVFDYY
jgi:hypothetical protein